MGEYKGRFVDLNYEIDGQKIPLLSVMMKLNLLYLNDRAWIEFSEFKSMVKKPEYRKWFKSNTIDKNISLVERKFNEYKYDLIGFTGDPMDEHSLWNGMADYSTIMDEHIDQPIQDLYDGMVEYGKLKGLDGMELLAKVYLVDTMFQLSRVFDQYMVQEFAKDIPEIRKVKYVFGVQKLEKIHDDKIVSFVDFVTNRNSHEPVDFNDFAKVKDASRAIRDVIMSPQIFLDGWNSISE